MSAQRSETITTYGTPKDRAKLAALARLRRKSVSTYLVEMIREQYAAIYDDADPESIDDRTDQRAAS